MTPEQKQQRINEIADRSQHPHRNKPTWADVNFLLSLVKSQEAGEDMSHFYTESSIVVDNLSKDLSALRSENRLMRDVVDTAIAYTVEFKTGMTNTALQRLAVAVNAYNDARVDETCGSLEDMPPVLWVSSNNQRGCFDARRHNQCTSDCRYLLASQVDVAYTDTLRDAAKRERDAATSMRSRCVEIAEKFRQRIQYETDEGMREAAFGDMVIEMESISLEEQKS